MAWVLYDYYVKGLLTGENTAFIDHDDNSTTTIKIALVTASYTPAQATDVYWGTPDEYEVSGTNYSAGGNVCANKSVTLSSHVITLDADDPADWAQSAGGFSDARYAILYKDTGNPATSNLIAYNDFGSSKGNVSGDLSVELAADGILSIQQSA